MSYLQVRDILYYASEFHKRAKALAARCQREGDYLLLDELHDRLQEHDQQIYKMLDLLEESTDEGVLDAWLQYDGARAVDRELAELRRAEELPDEDADWSARDAVTCLLDLETRLAEMCGLVGSQIQALRVRVLFDQLQSLEAQNLHESAWAAAAYGNSGQA